MSSGHIRLIVIINLVVLIVVIISLILLIVRASSSTASSALYAVSLPSCSSDPMSKPADHLSGQFKH